MNTGTIVQVNGPVVDVEFPAALPAIYNALLVDWTGQKKQMQGTLEGQQHLSDRRVALWLGVGVHGWRRADVRGKRPIPRDGAGGRLRRKEPERIEDRAGLRDD